MIWQTKLLFYLHAGQQFEYMDFLYTNISNSDIPLTDDILVNKNAPFGLLIKNSKKDFEQILKKFFTEKGYKAIRFRDSNIECSFDGDSWFNIND